MKDMFLAEELGYDPYEPYPPNEDVLTKKDFLSEDVNKIYAELRIKIEDLYYEFLEQNKISPNELHIHGSLFKILLQSGRSEIVDDYRFMGMLIITNPNPEIEVELKVSYNSLSAR